MIAIAGFTGATRLRRLIAKEHLWNAQTGQTDPFGSGHGRHVSLEGTACGQIRRQDPG
jgi:hypothetical protein